ncbi:ankyrin repeat domain-containing protein 13C-like [Chenopodium quinoa]|uniref:ankyrin repeat domain-containing protein 13C-like n=1 Tax=Chenopodium quinoa TaxID=63459 RepID=UPI000B781E93|nr:ankyrin repeat domain-containing protein 13C-like [Chenopodium quinoa]
MSKPPPHPSSAQPQPINPSSYSHSPAHYAVALHDHPTLTRLLSSLPKLADPTRVTSESDSLLQEKLSDQISSLLDRRDDIPFRDTPLHLAVRLNDAVSAQLLASAGADVSLQNSSGWNPLQDAVCRRKLEIARILVQHHHLAAWAKWRRRLPRLLAVLRRMRDFYLEIQFHFESSFVPFIGKIAPSDTYRIWKRDGNLRADTTLAGFDGMKIQRADQSFLFLGDGDPEKDIPEGSLIVLNRDDGKIFDAFENAGSPMTDDDVAAFCSQTSVYRPGMDVTKAELIPRTNWRRQDKIESVGEWKAKVFDVQNVVFSFRSRKVSSRDEQVLPLELDEEDDFLVAENFELNFDDKRRHSSFVKEEREWVSVGRKSVDINFAPSSKVAERRRGSSVNEASRIPVLERGRGSSVNEASRIPIMERGRGSSVNEASRIPVVPERRRASSVNEGSRIPVVAASSVEVKTKEKEYVKSLRPTVWLTEDFPLKTEEVLPLLDILANKVKAVRRLRELLTTKFPPGSFPVKIAIPVVPTVRVVITFSKFVELQPTESFYTPLSSPRFLSNGNSAFEEGENRTTPASSTSSWLRQSNSSRSSNKTQQCPEALISDPFAIPSGYSWESIDSKNRKMKKSKSVRKAK